MKVLLAKFYAWLLRQTTFVRYLVIAILLPIFKMSHAIH